MSSTQEIRVCMDIGSKKHCVGIGLSGGQLLEEFSIDHNAEGIDYFFSKIKKYEQDYGYPVSVAMEAYNGHARPIDQRVLLSGYRLFNINNNKFAQFKKIFPGAAKTDQIDVRMMFELFNLSDHLSISKQALQEVSLSPEVNNRLKRLTRRRKDLVNERVALVNRLQSDLNACIPGLLAITGQASNVWFLRFLTSRTDVRQLAKMHYGSLLRIRGIGPCYAKAIQEWQKEATFSEEVDWVSDMIIRDAKRILDLLEEVTQLEDEISKLLPESEIAVRIKTISGFGDICAAELAGEIGHVDRFKNEGSLALYLGMAVLNNCSGEYHGTKRSLHVNYRAKEAMMIGIFQNTRYCQQSKVYYDKKRVEGKKHNQAVRALGRHFVRIIWSMLKNQRNYECRD